MGGRTLDDATCYILNAAQSGGVVVVHTGDGASGIGDSILNEVTVAVSGAVSGSSPAGILLSNVVSQDVTRFALNEQKNEVLSGTPCTLIKKGTVYTDQVFGTPTYGAPAYLHAAGKVSATQMNSGAPRVGTFGNTLDANGFVKLYLDIN